LEWEARLLCSGNSPWEIIDLGPTPEDVVLNTQQMERGLGLGVSRSFGLEAGPDDVVGGGGVQQTPDTIVIADTVHAGSSAHCYPTI